MSRPSQYPPLPSPSPNHVLQLAAAQDFSHKPYCWWLKSCTTWDVWNPQNNGINYLSTGAGFLPSTLVKATILKNPGVSFQTPWMVPSQPKDPSFSDEIGSSNHPNNTESVWILNSSRIIYNSSISKHLASFQIKSGWKTLHLRSNKSFFSGTKMVKQTSWWWFQIFLIFTPIPGVSWSNLTIAYFSNGLVQPPTRNSLGKFSPKNP